jgi:hypothetical protein
MALKGKEEIYSGMSVCEAFKRGNELNTDYIIEIDGLIAPNIFNNDYEILHKHVEPYDDK